MNTFIIYGIFEKDFKRNVSYMLSEPLKLSEISFFI